MIVILVDTKGRARTGDAVTENLYARIRELETDYELLRGLFRRERARYEELRRATQPVSYQGQLGPDLRSVGLNPNQQIGYQASPGEPGYQGQPPYNPHWGQHGNLMCSCDWCRSGRMGF